MILSVKPDILGKAKSEPPEEGKSILAMIEVEFNDFKALKL